MKVPPFAATRDGDRVYGRGACDNKGPMTAMLLALQRLAIERPANAANITLALTVDEEYLFTGVNELVRGGVRYDGAIVAEPTDLNIVVGHKGGARWDVVVRGQAYHSSNPKKGVNAIYRMSSVIRSLERLAESLYSRPNDPLLGGPTLSVGMIEGGVAVNVVPDVCKIQVDRRLIPGETPASAHAECAAHLAADPEIDFPVECVPPWLNLQAMPDTINQSLAGRLRECVQPYRRACEFRGEPYGSDASALHAAKIPTVIFGPGSITKAHTDDEFVPLSEISLAAEILYQFCIQQ
jgi:acetylornithine deacetylase